MEFTGDYDFLSNFYSCPILFDGKTYPSVEHAFQAAKTLDEGERNRIRNAKTAAEAKKLGKQVALRKDWETKKLSIMGTLIFWKFVSNPVLAKLLKATGKIPLVETNYWHDNYWGDCVCKKCKHKPGQNHLGNILETTRKIVSIL